MFERLGHGVYRARRAVLAGALLLLVLGATWGSGVFAAMTSAGFEDPDSDSARALTRVEATVGRTAADVVVLYRYQDRTVDDPGFARAVTAHLEGLPDELVTSATTWWSTGGAASGLVSEDRRSTYAALQLAGQDDDAILDTYDALEQQLRTTPDGLDVRLGGGAAINSDITTQVGEDIARAEQLSLPVVMVLLVVVFGGLVAASLPLAIGALAILGSFVALRLLTTVTDVSIFAVNIVTMLGLGLAIDYSLFVVSRFREERRAPGATTESALVATMATAGRTVAFSGVTVAVALASLLLFPQVFLRSMGFGGMAAVLVAMLGALTVLPALLAVLGHRVDALRVPRPRFLRRARPAASGFEGQGAWYRVAHSVMRRPLLYVAVIVPLLLTAGLPFLRVEFGGVDHRALPTGTESRVVSETLLGDFAEGDVTSIDAVTDFAGGSVDPAALEAYRAEVAALDGVTSATVVGQRDGTAVVSARYAFDGIGEQARELVDQVRAVPAPEGATVLVGGRAADLRDLLASLGATLPWMALFVLSTTLVLLFLAFGSVVLPIKAVLMNVLSLSASFGALVWIFQDGNLSGLLGFTSTGAIEATQPILVLAMAFGLSMDYEVFLLSRIREQWDRTGDNGLAVATGLQRTGRIITSAAVLLVVVVGAFSTSGIVFIKMIGVGMIIAILVDATVVRALLVPATMRLLGRWNWWAPAPMARWWDRHGFRETGDPGPSALPGPRAEARPEVAVRG